MIERWERKEGEQGRRTQAADGCGEDEEETSTSTSTSTSKSASAMGREGSAPEDVRVYRYRGGFGGRESVGGGWRTWKSGKVVRSGELKVGTREGKREGKRLEGGREETIVADFIHPCETVTPSEEGRERREEEEGKRRR